MSIFRTSYIYVRNTYARILVETDEGYSFKYDTDYLLSENASAVSLTLPLQVEEYKAYEKSSKTNPTFSFYV